MQEIVVDCVESRQQVEADQNCDLRVVGSHVDAIENFQQRSFRGVSFPVCRLVLSEVGPLEQMWTQACQLESFQHLGDCRQIGDGPVVSGNELSSPAFFRSGSTCACL